jgi:VWFA-related protein
MWKRARGVSKPSGSGTLASVKLLKASGLLAGALLLSGAGQSQTPPDPRAVIPGVTTEVVKVDVVVRDGSGHAVRNLSRDDFQLYEDGKVQPLVQFQVVSRAEEVVPPSKSPSPGLPAPPQTIEAQRAPLPKRNVLLIVDDLHIAPGNLAFAKEALTKFVKEVAQEGDRIGLITTSSPGVSQNFTEERATLTLAIGQLHAQERTVQSGSMGKITPEQAELIARGDPNAIRLASMTFLADPILSHPTGPRGQNADAVGMEQTVSGQIRGEALRVLGEALSFSDVSLGTIGSIVDQLGGLPGRKICVLASDGFLMGSGTSVERRPALERIVGAAMRTGAVIYSLDTRGVVGSMNAQATTTTNLGPPPGLQESVDSAANISKVDTIAAIADQTGGFLVKGTNDLAGALGKILEDSNYYYVLGYNPPSAKRDGRFHKIQVKLTSKKGLEIRSRKGYFAPDDKKPSQPGTLFAEEAAPAPEAGEASALEALESGTAPADFPVAIHTAYVDLPPSGSQVFVQVRVGLANAHFDEVDGRFQDSLELVGRAYDEGQNPVGKPFAKKVDLNFSAAERTQAVRDGLSYRMILPLAPGKYELRVVAAEGQGGGMGATREFLEIPDLGSKRLTMSDVFLSSSDPAAAGKERIEVADLGGRFKRSSTLYFQVYVYNPLVDTKGAKDVVLQAQIRQGSKVIAASKPTPVAFKEKNAVPVPETDGMSLASLDAGDYTLRIVAFDQRARVNTSREITFSVE